jgi:hypothetical protein
MACYPSLPSLDPVRSGTPSRDFVPTYSDRGSPPRTEDDRGRGANSSVQRKPTTALACEGYAKQSFGLPSLSSVLRLRRAKTAYKLLTLLFDQLHQLLSLQLL